MYKTTRLLLSVISILGLTACAHTIQNTSGRKYLDRYSQSQAYQSLSELDADVFEIANVEPDIRFPARIGLARIEHQRLTAIPADEATYWADMVMRQDNRYGEFVPVSPLIAALVSTNGSAGPSGTGNVVTQIRKGAARQHLTTS